MTDLFLVSTELSPRYAFEPRGFRIRRRLRNQARDDFALVEIVPPIPKGTYENVNEDLAEAVLASRHEGTSLFPIKEWPTYVYICRLTYATGEPVPEDIDDKFTILDWGAVYPTREDAAAAQRMWLGADWRETWGNTGAIGG